ncbi:MAG: hypothetical protein LBR80_04915 [Deltaproteobacteria bacterium]|nr:hypothetical protein [Deltaproteobacteria bacterium]
MSQLSRKAGPEAPGATRPAASALAAAILTLAAVLLAAAPAIGGYKPQKSKYSTMPFLSLGRSQPQVLIIMAKDHRMYMQAYNNLIDLDGDGLVDSGFNPSLTYYGIFDHTACYTYNMAFSRSSFADTRHAEARNPRRPPELQKRLDIAVPKSAHGVCPGNNGSGTGPWHGNWLNWFATSRMDAMRRVLYGGRRWTDTAQETILAIGFVPRDGHVWGIEAVSDDLWAEKMRNMPYYDLSMYTGFPKPARGTYTFFARYQAGKGEIDSRPLIMAVTGVNARQKVKNFQTEIAIWDFIAGKGNMPDTDSLASGYRRFDFAGLVRVCNPRLPGGIGPNEMCEEYEKGVWKPVGLLQEFGADNRMFFGLMTGIAQETERKTGGGIRAHIDSMGRHYDFTTGLIRRDGMLRIMDQLRITGWDGTRYKDNTAWGSPMGEMLYEAVRYFAGAKSAYYTRNMYGGDPFSHFSNNWASDKPRGIMSVDCSRPIVVMISPVYPDYDTDSYPATNDPAMNAMRPLSSMRNPPELLKKPFNKGALLKAMSVFERIGKDGKKYFYARHWAEDCKPKYLVDLGQVQGLCPSEPGKEGGYVSAAVAWYARTHSFSSKAEEDTPMEIYAVGLADAYPEIVFDLEDGRAVKAIPSAEADQLNVLPYISYFVVDWQTDSTGLPFFVKIVASFDDRLQGSDYDRDGMGTYEFALLANRQGPDYPDGVPEIQLEPQGLRIHAGDLKDPWPNPKQNPYGQSAKPVKYYRFQNYRSPGGGRDYTLPKITIDRSKVIGFAVSSDAFGSGANKSVSIGYTVSGTTRDGIYMDTAHTQKNFNKKAQLDATHPWPNLAGVPSNFVRPDTQSKDRNTPWTCLYPGASGCGKATGGSFYYFMTRGFLLSERGDLNEFLPNPLWLMAKYGGFKDLNRNGYPDPGEWERDPEAKKPEPINYFEVRNAGELFEKLNSVFKSISRGQTFGSGTASSLVSDISGGISVQTIFYPRYSPPSDLTISLPFVGSVFALFLDPYGNLREDTDFDKKLTLKATAGGKGDKIVTFTTITRKPDDPPRCWIKERYITICNDPQGNNNPTPAKGSSIQPETPHQLHAVWDAGQWLMDLDDTYSAKLLKGPRAWTDAATQTLGRRRIYFAYRDQNLKAKMELFNSYAMRDQVGIMMLHDNYMEYSPRWSERSFAIEDVITFVTGGDRPSTRKREVPNPWRNNRKGIWRLGDVINSKPIVVANPASNFDLLYADKSYADFKSKMRGRRQMVYFGANDGMLHAVNMGFGSTGFTSAVSYSKTSRKFPKALAHDIGAELWAYIPMSVMPTLPFLADINYIHNFYVDMKPLVVDVKIRGVWRTVLIGGLRLGGRPIEPTSEDYRQANAYYGEVFCLDITDPEVEPKLLWNYTAYELGLMVGMPVLVRSRDKFYVMLPSGPVTDTVTNPTKTTVQVSYGGRSPYSGVSRQPGRIIVLDAETGAPAVNTDNNPSYLTAPVDSSFFNNAFLPRAMHFRDGGWSDHAAYFGLTETSQHGNGYDGGSLWRVEMADPYGNPLPPAAWKLKRLLDTGRPVTGAVNSTYDDADNLWVVFGTGRLFGQDDVFPCDEYSPDHCNENHDQYLYGIKEPLNDLGFLTFEDVTPSAHRILDVSGAMVVASGDVVKLKPTEGLTTVAGGASYQEVERATRSPGVAGWKRRLDALGSMSGVPMRAFEMVTTQPKFMTMGGGNSLMAVTSFMPGRDSCFGYGDGFFYVLDTFTGLPRPDTAQMFKPVPRTNTIPEGLVPGVVPMGIGNPTEATIVVGRGRTVFRAASSDGGVVDLEYINTPGNSNSVTAWREVSNVGFRLTREAMTVGLSKR